MYHRSKTPQEQGRCCQRAPGPESRLPAAAGTRRRCSRVLSRAAKLPWPAAAAGHPQGTPASVQFTVLPADCEDRRCKRPLPAAQSCQHHQLLRLCMFVWNRVNGMTKHMSGYLSHESKKNRALLALQESASADVVTYNPIQTHDFQEQSNITIRTDLLAAIDQWHQYRRLHGLRGLVDDHHVERAAHARERRAARERQRARHDVRLLQHRRTHAVLLPSAAAVLTLHRSGLTVSSLECVSSFLVRSSVHATCARPPAPLHVHGPSATWSCCLALHCMRCKVCGLGSQLEVPGPPCP